MEVEYCGGCIYWRELSGHRACHFAIDTYTCRLTPAEGCPFWTNEKGETKALISRIDDARAMELHRAGKTDKVIGQEFGVCANAILSWRRKNNLPANQPAKRAKKEDARVPLKVYTINDLPGPLKEKVEAKLAEIPAESKLENQLTGAGVMTKVMTSGYDPLIYETFDHAIKLIYDSGMQPSLIWRQLLEVSERQLLSLGAYTAISEAACRCAVELAAIAAAEDIINH